MLSRIILGHTESRVLRRIPIGDQGRRQTCCRRLDCTSLQLTRTHSAIGMISPVNFENRLTRMAQAA
jgi:hypothetical protein